MIKKTLISLVLGLILTNTVKAQTDSITTQDSVEVVVFISFFIADDGTAERITLDSIIVDETKTILPLESQIAEAKNSAMQTIKSLTDLPLDKKNIKYTVPIRNVFAAIEEE